MYRTLNPPSRFTHIHTCVYVTIINKEEVTKLRRGYGAVRGEIRRGGNNINTVLMDEILK